MNNDIYNPTQYCSDKNLGLSEEKAEEQGERSRERGFRLSPLPPAPCSHAVPTKVLGLTEQYCNPTFNFVQVLS